MADIAELSAHELPVPRACPFAPPEQYRAMRESAPVQRVRLQPSGQLAWVVTRHEDVRKLLADPRLSSDRRDPRFPMFVRERIATDLKPSLIGMDPPEHGQARRDVVGEFTVKRMKALQPRIQEIVDDAVDAMLAGPKPADLVSSLSLPVPSLVICELLGVPYRDHEFFQSNTAVLLKREVEPERRSRALDAIRDYLDELVAEKEREPTDDDLLGRQVLRQRETGRGDHEDLVSLAFLLLVAGHETTANMISLGTLALLDNPETLAAIREDPGKTLGAVEELLRYFTITDFAAVRLALEDIEIGGVTIKAGEGVVALGNAANRDPEAFPDPDALDIERGGRHHVAFGFGAHQCLGQNLARMELQIVFDTLFRRVPGLRLAADADDLPFKDDAAIYGVYHMPVTW
jgi:cytochrome P450